MSTQEIFKTTDFAYRQIQIERPLKLSFDFNDEKIKELLVLLYQQAHDESGIKSFIESFKGETYNDRKKLEDIITKRSKDFITGKLGAGVIKKFVSLSGTRDENAEICVDKDGNPEADGDLRDHENVPYGTDVKEYFNKEVRPYVSDAWINESVRDHKDNQVGVVGYEIPFTRYFYKYEAPRSLEAIEKDIEEVENELLTLLKQL
jgi:type I restriction enzyme M protein